jgi:hypothetical protein
MPRIPTRLLWIPTSLMPDLPLEKPSLVLVWTPHLSPSEAHTFAYTHALKETGTVQDLTWDSYISLKYKLIYLQEEARENRTTCVALVRASDLFEQAGPARSNISGFMILYVIVDAIAPLEALHLIDGLEDEQWALAMSRGMQQVDLVRAFEYLTSLHHCPALLSSEHGNDAWRLCYYDFMRKSSPPDSKKHACLYAQDSHVTFVPYNLTFVCR